MAHAQGNGSGARTELEDEKVRKEDILSNRDETQRRPGQSRDGKGVQVEEYKDIPTNQRPDPKAERQSNAGQPSTETDRPGFDLGGSSGKTEAGRGLGLGKDAKDDRSDWSPPGR